MRSGAFRRPVAGSPRGSTTYTTTIDRIVKESRRVPRCVRPERSAPGWGSFAPAVTVVSRRFFASGRSNHIGRSSGVKGLLQNLPIRWIEGSD